MTGDPVRIAQFWQAVEIFSLQSLSTIDPKNHTVATSSAAIECLGTSTPVSRRRNPAVSGGTRSTEGCTN
jgi:hypothetical protein